MQHVLQGQVELGPLLVDWLALYKRRKDKIRDSYACQSPSPENKTQLLESKGQKFRTLNSKHQKV